MTRATSTAFAAGLGLGAGLMFFLDPDRGSRRRTHTRNQIAHASHRVQDASTRGRALGQRVAGAFTRVPGLRRQPQLPWPTEHRGGMRRAAMAIATAAGLGLMARAARSGSRTSDVLNVAAID
jgi:hypothetical protein